MRRPNILTSLVLLIMLLTASGTPFGPALAGPLPTSIVSPPRETEQAPWFQLQTLDGSLVDSQAFKGRVVVLNFWAPWCLPCKEEMPSLDRLYRAMASEHFRLYAVTADIRRDEIEAFWKQLDLQLPVLLDEEKELSHAMMIRNLPTTIIIGADGNVYGRAMGPREWDSPDAVALIHHLMKK